MSAALTRASAAARVQVPELNVQNGVLKALSFLFEYIGEMGKDYIYAVSPLLEDALMDRDLVHRQTAASVVQARALLVASRAPRPSWCAAAPPRALLHGTGPARPVLWPPRSRGWGASWDVRCAAGSLTDTGRARSTWRWAWRAWAARMR